jgi:PleD family two-component response regulator
VTARVSAETAPVTVSAGVAQHRAGEAHDAWLRRADQALLEAKRAGKNRVVRESAA